MTAKKKTREERRKATRANRVVAVSHRLFKRASRQLSANWSLSTTRNMSVSGLLFLSDAPYRLGDIIQVNVTMSGVIDILQGFGEVVRLKEKSSRLFEVAIKFVNLKPRSRSAKSHLS